MKCYSFIIWTISDSQLSWDQATLESATEICNWRLEKRYVLNPNYKYLNDNKAQSIGLSDHTHMSILAGFVYSHHGATINYLKDRSIPGEVTCTVNCRTKSMEKNLNLWSLINQVEFPRLRVDFEGTDEEDEESLATHIVTDVFYGAELHCIFSQKNDGHEDDEEIQNEMEQTLSLLAGKWRDSLYDSESLSDFKKRFNSEENHLITRLNCRLYADLQVEPVIERCFFDAYEVAFNLMDSVCSDGNKAIPIAVRLCPLNVLLDSSQLETKKRHFRDVNNSHLTEFCQLFAYMKQILHRAESIYAANKESALCEYFPEFIDIVSARQESLKDKLKKSLVKARRSDSRSADDYIEEFVQSAFSYHPNTDFKLWLDFKEEELNLMELMVREAGDNGIHFLLNKDGLAKHLTESSEKEYSLVLIAPLLNEQTSDILYSIRNGEHSSSIEENPEISWRVKEFLLKKIREFAAHIEKNKEICDRVQFIVTFDDEPFRCSYSLYQGDNLLKDKIRRLPDTPTGLRISLPPAIRSAKRPKTSSSSVLVEWDYQDLGYPFNFLLEYRVKGSADPWIQKRTTETGQTQLAVNLETESTIEIRVAAETCIGRSEFSQIVDNVPPVASLSSKKNEGPLLPPTGVEATSVTHNSVELSWTPNEDYDVQIEFRVDYWQKGQDPFDVSYHLYGSAPCTLEDLEPETTFLLTVSTVTEDETKTSPPSDPVEFTTTKKIRFAEKFVNSCKKIGNENGVDIYAVPFTKSNGRLQTAERFVITEPEIKNYRRVRENPTILIIGTSGFAKTSVINAMANYIFDVKEDDPFRFQLIGPSEESRNVVIYDLNYVKGFRFETSLTIIDTPNYVEEDPEKSMKTTEQIRKFFDDPEFIHKVDMIGFVLDSSETDLKCLPLHIYCSLISIFGIRVKENVNFFLTSAENEDPFLWSDVLDAGLVPYGPFLPGKQNYHKFSFPLKTLESVFVSLKVATTKLMSARKQALDEKRRLNSILYGLRQRTKINLNKLQELRKTKEEFCRYWSNEDFEFELDVTEAEYAYIPFGEYATNCNNCEMTCHFGCSEKRSSADCDVMDRSVPKETRSCLVCRCPWEVHDTESTNWYQDTEKKTTCGAIRENYENKLDKELTAEEVMSALDADVAEKKTNLLEDAKALLRHANRLNEIDEYLESKSKKQFFNDSRYVTSVAHDLVETEQEDKQQDWQERIIVLQNLRQLAEQNLVEEENLIWKEYFERFLTQEEEEEGLMAI